MSQGRKNGKAAGPQWKLKKTLSRKPEFRPIEQDDMKYVWAAYKKGCLESMGFEGTDLSAEDFREAFEKEVVSNYHAAWTLFANTPKGRMPVGLVLGFWSHPDPKFAPFMIVGDQVWFSWASTRNRIESAAAFYSEMRKEIPMVEYARRDDRKFFETLARHGIMRRIGTSHNVYEDEPATVFETRKADKS